MTERTRLSNAIERAKQEYDTLSHNSPESIALLSAIIKLRSSAVAIQKEILDLLSSKIENLKTVF